MKCKREDVLNNCLKSKLLKEKTMLTSEDLRNVNFTDQTPDLLVEAVKKLIISYCQEDSEVHVLRKINQIIATHSSL